MANTIHVPHAYGQVRKGGVWHILFNGGKNCDRCGNIPNFIRIVDNKEMLPANAKICKNCQKFNQ